MRRYLLGKTLALGVVVLFISVGIHPAFAVDTKTSTETLSNDTENENNSNDISSDYIELNHVIIHGIRAENSGPYNISRFLGWHFDLLWRDTLVVYELSTSRKHFIWTLDIKVKHFFGFWYLEETPANILAYIFGYAHTFLYRDDTNQ
jgi:hypothetical protein